MDEEKKKFPCPDCRSCQWCSDSRCRMCLRGNAAGCRKLSLQEQIELYEAVNKGSCHNDRDIPGDGENTCRKD